MSEMIFIISGFLCFITGLIFGNLLKDSDFKKYEKLKKDVIYDLVKLFELAVKEIKQEKELEEAKNEMDEEKT